MTHFTDIRLGVVFKNRLGLLTMGMREDGCSYAEATADTREVVISVPTMELPIAVGYLVRMGVIK